MRYQKANEILPKELVELIQSYMDGGYVYIPRKEENRKSWGETSSARKEIQARNREIYKKYRQGMNSFICRRRVSSELCFRKKSWHRGIRI